MKKVLIISYHFSPLNSMGAKRYGTMHKYMRQYGFTPFVLTTNVPRKLSADFSADADIDLKNVIDENRVVRVGRIQESRPKSIVVNCILSLLDECKIVMRSIDANSFGWYEECKKALECGELGRIQRPDIIVATFPDIGSIYVARFLSKQWSVPYVVEIRDLITEYAEAEEGYHKSRILDSLLEKWLLKNAVGLIAVTSGFKSILQRKYSKWIATVYNGWESDFEKYDNHTVHNEGIKYLYYAGRFYEHRMKSFEILLEALKEVNKYEAVYFKIRGTGPRKYLGQVSRLIKDKDMQEYVTLLPPCKEEIVRQEQIDAFINVVLSDLTDNKDYLLATIPGKAMELLCYSNPILVVASGKSEISSILQKTDKGVVVSCKSDIVKYIQEGYKSKIGIKKEAMFYSRKNQTKKLCAFLEFILKKTSKEI